MSSWLDVLLSRLSWPSVIVRAQACRAIANLLIDKEFKEITYQSLTRWMSEQRLESVCFLGILPLILTARCQKLGVGSYRQLPFGGNRQVAFAICDCAP